MLQQSPIDIQDIESIHVSTVIQDCINAVEEQPTAYDVDKVLEQLEYSRVPNTGIAGYHKVVEIVKGGGIDGNTNT